MGIPTDRIGKGRLHDSDTNETADASKTFQSQHLTHVHPERYHWLPESAEMLTYNDALGWLASELLALHVEPSLEVLL